MLILQVFLFNKYNKKFDFTKKINKKLSFKNTSQKIKEIGPKNNEKCLFSKMVKIDKNLEL
jgi:hypothetical protein